MTVLASTTHEVPHKCLEANDLSGRAECISERLVQCNIARGHSEMRDAKDRQVIPETVPNDNLSSDEVSNMLLDSFERRGIGSDKMTKFNSCGCGPIVGDLHGWGDEGVQDDITLIVNNPYAGKHCSCPPRTNTYVGAGDGKNLISVIQVIYTTTQLALRGYGFVQLSHLCNMLSVKATSNPAELLHRQYEQDLKP